MFRFASLIRSAIRRRTPITLISDVSPPADGGCGLRAATPGPPWAALAALRSSRTMRPPGPDPTTLARSIPASRARRRLAGEVMIRPVGATGAGITAAAGGVDAGIAREAAAAGAVAGIARAVAVGVVPV